MPTPLKTCMLVADDHPIVLRGLRTVLNAQPDLEVVAEAADGDAAVARALADDIHAVVSPLGRRARTFDPPGPLVSRATERRGKTRAPGDANKL